MAASIEGPDRCWRSGRADNLVKHLGPENIAPTTELQERQAHFLCRRYGLRVVRAALIANLAFCGVAQ